MTTETVACVLFDLDDTLFDHNHATRCAVKLLRDIEPAFHGWTPEELRRHHSEILELIHREVVAGRLKIDDARRERFRRLLLDAGVEPDAAVSGRAAKLADSYRNEYSRNWRPVEGALELLAALRARGLSIGVVTNNLRAEQEAKLQRIGLGDSIDALITSEDIGTPKPSPIIFDAALSALRVAADRAVMVGDAWDTDIAGALASGVRPVWFNWRGLGPRDVLVTELASLTPTRRALEAIDPSAG